MLCLGLEGAAPKWEGTGTDPTLQRELMASCCWVLSAPALRAVSEPLGPLNCLMASLFMLLRAQVGKIFGFPVTKS